ncbi:ABC transporter permease [Janibacter anophelis]|uniref:ABC transporter permease n=1 Tax=Janibacter anophelis TaxID=319054 RepID=UPI003F7ECA1B
MSTATTTTDVPTTEPTVRTEAAAPVDISGDRIPFVRLVVIELRKMVDTRAGMWMLITMAGISFLVAAGLLLWGEDGGEPFTNFLGLIVMPTMILLPIMGIMSATQEWSQRTGLATFTLVPRRGRIIAAKIAAALVLCLLLLTAAGAAAALGTALGGGEFSLTGISLAGVVLAGLIYTLQGVAFGAAFLNTPIAIVSSLVLPTVWTVLTAMSTWMSDAAQWLDLNVVTGPLTTGTMTGENWAQLATASLVWVGLPLAIGTHRILTREVK